MKSKIFVSFFAASILMTGLASCSSDDPKPETKVEVKEGYVLMGRIADKNSMQPLEGVLINIEGLSCMSDTTDADGFYAFAVPDKKTRTLIAKKSGYFDLKLAADFGDGDEIGNADISNGLIMMAVYQQSIDPTVYNSMVVDPLNAAPAIRFELPENTLPSNVTKMYAVNYVLSEANNYGSIYLDPYGVKLKDSVVVSMHNNGLPAGIAYGGLQLISADQTKASTLDVTYNSTANTYEFKIGQLGNYVLNVDMSVKEGPVVTSNSPYQTLSIEDACGANTTYTWPIVGKAVTGYELVTDLKASVTSQFAGLSSSDVDKVVSEITRSISTYMNAIPGKIEKTVPLGGSVVINPGTMNIFNSYLLNKTSVFTFNFTYNNNPIVIDVEVAEHIGVKVTNTAVACGDHSGGGSHSGGGTN